LSIAAIYLRVSTLDQTTQNQVVEVRQLALARGYADPVIYEETGSAVKRRPVFDRMMAEARAGRISVICVWSLDRLGRGFSAFDTFRELSRLNVRLLSVREPWTDVDGPARELLVAVMSWVSGFERQRLIERTKAGLERARRQGKKLGRPRLSPLKLAAAAEDVAAGMSQRGAARKRGISEAALRAYLRAQKTPPPPTPLESHHSLA
jgi:DNA invertase Pin-like site-specific DNA recombinase